MIKLKPCNCIFTRDEIISVYYYNKLFDHDRFINAFEWLLSNKYYFFSSEVKGNNIVVDNKGVALCFAYLGIDINDMDKYELTFSKQFNEQFLAPHFGLRVISIKVTELEKGYVIGVSANHQALDGIATTMFINDLYQQYSGQSIKTEIDGIHLSEIDRNSILLEQSLMSVIDIVGNKIRVTESSQKRSNLLLSSVFIENAKSKYQFSTNTIISAIMSLYLSQMIGDKLTIFIPINNRKHGSNYPLGDLCLAIIVVKPDSSPVEVMTDINQQMISTLGSGIRSLTKLGKMTKHSLIITNTSKLDLKDIYAQYVTFPITRVLLINNYLHDDKQLYLSLFHDTCLLPKNENGLYDNED